MDRKLIRYQMPKTDKYRQERRLLRIIESDESSTDQVLEASRQLTQLKRITPRPRRKRNKVDTGSSNSVLGSK